MRLPLAWSSAILIGSASGGQDAPRLTVERPLEGVVTDADAPVRTPILDGTYSNAPPLGRAVELVVERDGTYTLALRSYFFDAYLILRDASGALLAEDDDGLLRQHARITLSLAAHERYLLTACALHGGRGAFELSIVEGPTAAGDASSESPLADARRGLEVVAAKAGAESVEAALALEALASILIDEGDVSEALRHVEHALELVDRDPAPDDPRPAVVWNTLGFLLSGYADEPERARELHVRALRLRERTLGDRHPATDQSRNNLAHVLTELGEFEAAGPLFEKVVEVREAALGADHPLTALGVRALGVHRMDVGDSSGARFLLERAVESVERGFGPNDAETAQALNDLGVAYTRLGEFALARPVQERALAIYELVLGPASREAATARMNLGMLLHVLGDLRAALELKELAVADFEALLDGNDAILALALTSLADLLFELGADVRARDLYSRALSLAESALGPSHTTTAIVACNLSRVVTGPGANASAVALLEAARETFEARLGLHHPWTARVMHNLAGELSEQGALDDALALRLRAAEVHAATLGPAHPFTVPIEGALALLFWRRGELDQAWLRARDAHARALEHLVTVLPALSEEETYLCLARVRWLLDLLQEIAIAKGSSDALATAYGAQLAWKGQVARLLTAERERLGSADPDAREILDELRSVQRELSAQSFAREVPDAPTHLAHFEELLVRRDELERAWRRAGAPARVAPPSVDELHDALPERSAVVDFLIGPSVDREALARGESDVWREPRVRAWIARADAPEVQVVDLGAAARVHDAVRRELAAIVELRGVAARGSVGPPAGESARELLWTPLESALEGVDTIFLSPDGFLATLPFEVLTLDDGSFLLEQRSFVYFQDARTIGAVRDRSPESDSLLAVGGLDFGRRADLEVELDPRLDVAARAGSALPRGGFMNFWGRLPATSYESQVIHDVHEATFGADARRILLQGAEATEERLKSALPRHGVLHLATHGFFQPDGVPSLWSRARTRSTERAGQLIDVSTPSGYPVGLLSGIVCSGANVTPSAGREDGYLTAEEVGWLDLSRVELVVLSACETGLGRAESGEGLVGLRRAFLTAGAGTVVSSLWNVRDDSTSELMQRFYENLWMRGQGRLEALREARLWLLERNRRQAGEALPGTWGAFVLSGAWR